MAKLDNFYRIFVKTQKGICTLEIGKILITGERKGKGTSIYIFDTSLVLLGFKSTKKLLAFLQELQEEVMKYENLLQ